jgi:hypothetical protein
MPLTEKLNRFRDRINPDRAERAARAMGKPDAEIPRVRAKAERRQMGLSRGISWSGLRRKWRTWRSRSPK